MFDLFKYHNKPKLIAYIMIWNDFDFNTRNLFFKLDLLFVRNFVMNSSRQASPCFELKPFTLIIVKVYI